MNYFVQYPHFQIHLIKNICCQGIIPNFKMSGRKYKKLNDCKPIHYLVFCLWFLTDMRVYSLKLLENQPFKRKCPRQFKSNHQPPIRYQVYSKNKKFYFSRKMKLLTRKRADI